ASLRSTMLGHPPDILRVVLVRTAGLEPARPLGAEDFKSPASTGSATSAWSGRYHKSADSPFRFRRSRISLPGLKYGTRLALTDTASPVRGLRPTRASRWRVEKAPNPRSSTRPP